MPRAVVGLHHRAGEEHLPLDGADHENREAAVVRERGVTPAATTDVMLAENRKT